MISEKQDINSSDITKIRKIVSPIIDLLERNILDIINNKEIHLDKKNKEMLIFLKNVVLVVNKLSNLLAKVIPLEKGIDGKEGVEQINSNDLEILKRYIRKLTIED